MSDITLKDQEIFMCLAADIQLLIEKFGHESTMDLIDLAFDIDLYMNLGHPAEVHKPFGQKFLDALRAQIESDNHTGENSQ